MIMDLHIHSCFSRTRFNTPSSRSRPSEIVAMALEKGLDAIAVADHNELEGSLRACELAEGTGLVCVPASEVSSREGHILAYNISEPIPRGLPAAEVIDRVRDQNGLAVAAHPFNIAVAFRKRVFQLDFHGIEVFNARCTANRKAHRAARAMGLARIGGSDAHTLCEIGNGFTVSSARCEGVHSVIDAIRQRRTEGMGTRARLLRDIGVSALRTLRPQPPEV